MRAARGISIVELMLSASIFTMVLWGLFSAGPKAVGLFRVNFANSNVDDRAMHTIDRIVREVRSAGLDFCTPRLGAPLSSPSLTFQEPSGFDGEVVWGPTTTIAFELDPGEKSDDIDNDGDGLVDEGRVVWTQNPGLAGEVEVILCRRVTELADGEVMNGADDNGNGLRDEAGLSFEFDGSNLTVRLSLADLDSTGHQVTRVIEETVAIRN